MNLTELKHTIEDCINTGECRLIDWIDLTKEIDRFHSDYDSQYEQTFEPHTWITRLATEVEERCIASSRYFCEQTEQDQQNQDLRENAKNAIRLLLEDKNDEARNTYVTAILYEHNQNLAFSIAAMKVERFILNAKRGKLDKPDLEEIFEYMTDREKAEAKQKQLLKRKHNTTQAFLEYCKYELEE